MGKKWFEDAKLRIFIHYGIYAVFSPIAIQLLRKRGRKLLEYG